jgi:hypothetical protein
VFESYASIVSKLKGYSVVSSAHFALTKLLSSSGSCKAAPWFTNVASVLVPVGKCHDFDAMSVTT